MINENLAIQESLLKKKDTLKDTQKEDLEVANQIVSFTKSDLEYYATAKIIYTVNSASDFYSSYVEFCESNRNIPMNYNNFQNEMTLLGFKSKLQRIVTNKAVSVQRRFIKAKPTPFGNL